MKSQQIKNKKKNIGPEKVADIVTHMFGSQHQIQEFKPYVDLHAFSLSYLCYSFVSRHLQYGFPKHIYPSKFSKLIKKQQIVNYMNIHQKFDIQCYSQTYKHLADVLKLKQNEVKDKENYKWMVKCLYIALNCKNKKYQKQTWSQQQWGNNYYIKIIEILVEQIVNIERDQCQKQKVLTQIESRNNLFKTIYDRIYHKIQSQNHCNGLKKLIKYQTYCFLASYFNFDRNQLFQLQQAINYNLQQLHKIKSQMNSLLFHLNKKHSAQYKCKIQQDYHKTQAELILFLLESNQKIDENKQIVSLSQLQKNNIELAKQYYFDKLKSLKNYFQKDDQDKDDIELILDSLRNQIQQVNSDITNVFEPLPQDFVTIPLSSCSEQDFEDFEENRSVQSKGQNMIEQNRKKQGFYSSEITTKYSVQEKDKHSAFKKK